MTSDTSIQAPAPAEPATPGRRNFLRRAGGVGATAVAAIAATWTDAPSAFAAPGCCYLAYPNGPWCGGHKGTDAFRCPSGYHKYAWYCVTGHLHYACWECARGSNCHNGPWSCSNFVAIYV